MSGKYKAYPAYKDAKLEWIDSIPKNWSLAPLKYMALEKDSLFLDGDWIESKDISDNGIRYITTGNVGEGQYKEQGAGFITDEKFIKLGCTEVFPGDVLISRLNNPIGRACVVPDLHSRIVTSVDNVIFRPDGSYFKQYLVYLFSSKDYFKHTSELARGATMQRISRGLLGNIRLMVPSYEEQKAIANFLNHETTKIDTLIEEQKTLIRLLQEKRQAVISHAVTKGLNPNAPMKDSGVEWLGEVPEHWEVTHLKYLVQAKAGIQMGPFGGMLKDLEYKDTGFKLYGQENTISGDFSKGKRWLTRERYYELSNYNLEDGDIVLTRKGSLGNARLIKNLTTPGVIDSDTIRVRVNPNKLNGVFLSLLMHEAHYIAEQIQRTRRGSVLPGLNSETIANLKFLTPPLEEQGKLVAEIQKIIAFYDHSLAECLSKSKLLQERRTALISAAVTGKIDVRDWTPPAPQQEQQQEMALCN